MDIFQFLSIISFGLSSYLAITQIYNSLVRVDADILALYKMGDMIYIKTSVNNLSSNPVAITEITLSNRNQNFSTKSTHYDKTLATLTKRTGKEITGFGKLTANGVPINIPTKSALAFYLAFPVSSNLIDTVTNGKMTLDLKINGKHRSINFDATLKNSPREQLQKELKQ